MWSNASAFVGIDGRISFLKFNKENENRNQNNWNNQGICIFLIKGEEIISDEQNVAETLNTYFIDAAQNLDIKKFYDIDTNDSEWSPEDKID